MSEAITPRFRSPQEALRFYFRAGELISNKVRPGVISMSTPFNRAEPPNVFRDFIGLDTCFQGMKEDEAWLLYELYGPTFFGTPQRTVTRACAAARRKFPAKRWNRTSITRFRRRVLKTVQQHIRETYA